MFPFTHGVIASSSAQTVSTDFIIRVKTDNAGTSASNQFTLPTATGTYNYDVDWGDGVIENITTSTSQTHTYPASGTYTIKISGTFPRIFFNNGGDRRKLVEIINFGDVGWDTLSQAFYGCSNAVIKETCTGNFDNVISCFRAFQGMSSNNFFPAIAFPVCTDFQVAFYQNNFGDKFYPTDFRAGTSFVNAFEFSNITIFRSSNMSSGTNFRRAFANNPYHTFEECDMSSAIFIGGANAGAWQSCGVISDFKTRNFFSITGGANCFAGTTIPTSDYSDILVTQRANNPNNSVTFHGGSSKYNTAGGTARGELVSIQSWPITDGGPA